MSKFGVSIAPVLQSLCETEPAEVTGQLIQESGERGALEALIGLGALVQSGSAETLICFGCDSPHAVAVEFAGDGSYRAYCTESGYQVFDPDLLCRYSVSEDWIVSSIQSSLGMRPKAGMHGDETTIAYLGRARFGAYPCELFFGRRLSELARFEAAVRAMSAHLGREPAILMSTTRPELIPRTLPPRVAIVNLSDVLEIGDGKVALDDGPFLAALRGRDNWFRNNGIGFRFSPGYRSATVGANDYSFSDKQARVVEALDEARRSGVPRLHQTEIQGKADTSQRVGQLFSRHPAYGTLIKYDRAGYYWLDL